MFQHVKQYRKDHGLTQEALGELLGMNAKFVYCLEKHKPRIGQLVYTPQEEKVLNLLFGDTPKAPEFYGGLPTITGQDLIDIRKARKLTQEQAGDLIGISGTHWGAIESGKSKEDLPHVRRWYTLLLMANLPEYFNSDLTPEPEAPMVEVLPNVASEPVMLPANVASDDFADQPGLIPFAYGSQKVRVKWIDNKPWFMLTDVCRAIGYKSIQHAIGLIRERDIRKVECIDSFGRVQLANFVSQPGMSQFFLRARVPAVEPFENWVFDELLPSVYETGRYQPQQTQIPTDPFQSIGMIGQALQTIAQQMQIQEQKIAHLEQTVQNVSYLEVSKTDRSDVVEIVKGELEEEKAKQKVHYRKRKALVKRVSEVAWKAIERTGGSHKDVIMTINKRIKKALAGAYGYAISRERYTDDDFDMAYRVIAVCESEIKDFPQQGQIDFGGAA